MLKYYFYVIGKRLQHFVAAKRKYIPTFNHIAESGIFISNKWLPAKRTRAYLIAALTAGYLTERNFWEKKKQQNFKVLLLQMSN